ncbi:hypothetical protein [Candidatus Vondammii sp. HM_W22]|uniref:hypothetical protein n=1 Tax=Candidatus Vondammii sp. HM_W22 TaxID=2687299 RepID=UPI001F12E866|nr:hypothetical protein [Candidatus Vondammii sp. HM_W22]
MSTSQSPSIHSLEAEGITKKDRIGLFCINSGSFAIAYAYIVKSGAVVVPVSLLLNRKEIVYRKPLKTF